MSKKQRAVAGSALAFSPGGAAREAGGGGAGVGGLGRWLLGAVLALSCVAALLVFPSSSARADTATATLTVNSISRGTDGSLSVDATGTASGFLGSPACLGIYYDCYMSLTVQYTDGTTADITHVDNIQTSDPYTHEFVWTGQSAKITAMQIRIDTPNHNNPLYSAWVPVSDPAPAPSAALTVNSVTRSAADNSLAVDVTGTATGYMGTSACPWGSDCFMTLEFKYTDGTTTDITHVDNIQNSAYPYSHEFAWSGQSAKISAVQVRVDTPSHTNPIYSDWVAVTDPFAAASAALTVNSISRSSTDGSLSIDATGTASSYYVSPACPSGNDCYMSLTVKYADGTTSDITHVDNLQNSPSPYTHEFAWTGQSAQITAVQVRIDTVYHTNAVYSSWVPVTDPYTAPSATLTVNSVTRSAADNSLAIDATGTTSGFLQKACPPGNDCYMSLTVKYTDGTTADITHVDNIQNSPYPYSHEFAWTGQSAKITALQIRVDTTAHTNQLFSDWVPVTDPYTAPSAALTVNSVSRSATDGSLTVDATGTATSYYVSPACPSGSDCFMTLVFKYTDGTTSDIANVHNLQNSPSPYTHEFVWTGQSAQITAVQVRIDTPAHTNAFYSAWMPVTDPYTPPSATLVVNSSSRASDGTLSLTATGTTSGFLQKACPPGNDCYMSLTVKHSDGTTADITHVDNIQSSPYPYTHQFAWSGQSAKITAVQIRIDTTAHTNALYSSWVPISDITAAEQAGGSNPAVDNCGCSHADPVNTATGEFYANSTDLSIPGAPAALELTRGYSSVRAQSDGPFGYGSASNISMSLTATGAGTPPASVSITQEQGSVTDFALNSAGTYQAGPEIHATLTYDSATATFTYTRQGTQVFTFSQSGQLLTAGGLHGTTATYAYTNGQLTQITASGGRAITLAWTGNHVISATDSAGRSTSYNYDSNGNLTAVTAADGAKTTYGYSGHYLTTLTKPGGGVTTNTYDTANRVVSQANPDGKTATISYSGSTTTITAPDGSQTVETYSSGALATRVTGAQTPSPRTTTFAYSQADDLTAETDPLGNTVAYTYDGSGNVLTKTDPLGHTTAYTYDALRDVLTATDPLNRTAANTYDSAGDRLTSTDPAGNKQSWTYNADGTVASWTNGAGGVTAYAYDAAGNRTTATDPDGRTSTTAYNAAEQAVSVTKPGATAPTKVTLDPAGRVLTLTDPDGNTTTNVYDGDGNLVKTTSPTGAVTAAAYDPADLKTSMTDPNGHTTTYGYDNAGRLVSTTDPAGHTVKAAYDAFGEKASATDANGNTTAYGYDAAGNQTSITQPTGAVTTTAYDAAGQKTSVTDADGRTTSYGYDSAGEQTTTTDPLHRVTTTAYTPDGRTDTLTRPDGSTERYVYDALGDVTSFTNADGKAATYAFDAAGLLTSKTEPGGIATSYTYNAAGERGTSTDANGTVTTYGYDGDGHLTSQKSGTDPAVTYVYDADGHRTRMADATGTSTYTYDPAGHMTAETNGAGASIGYTYDNTGSLAAIAYPGTGRTATYTHDAAGNTTGVADWAGHTVTFAYDANGQETSQTDANGLTQTITHDAAGQVTDMAAANSTGTIADFAYTYDPAGQLTKDITAGAAMTAATNTYTYNQASQVATDNNGAYTTTPAGEVQTASNGDTLTYNAKQQLTTLATGNGTTSYTYDADGNRTSRTTGSTVSTYAYDAAGNLASVTGTPSGTITYTANGNGLRTSRTQNGSTSQWTWDTNATLPLLLDDGNQSYIYGSTGTPVLQIDDATGTARYFTADLLGSVRAVTDNSGAPIGTTNYGTYGAVTAATGTQPAIGYTGAWTDPATGLVYLRARDYDPTARQFTTIDPAIDLTRQPYAYAHNTPTQATDPTGLWASLCSGGSWFAQQPTVNDIIRANVDASPKSADAWAAEDRQTLANISRFVGALAAFVPGAGGVGYVGFNRLAGDIEGQDPNRPLTTGDGAMMAIGIFPGGDDIAGIAKAASESDHIVLGLRAHGLEDTAAKIGGRTLLNDPEWMSSLQKAIGDHSTKLTVSLDGMSGSSTYQQVMGAATRGASGAGRSYTDWEMAQLFQGGRLPDVTFRRGGSIVENPWGQ